MTTARTIKRYANRKLYDTRDSRYVTLDHIAAMVRAGDDVRVVENTTRADLTTATLAQIIFEEEKKTPRLSVAGLRKIIQGGMPAAGAPPAAAGAPPAVPVAGSSSGAGGVGAGGVGSGGVGGAGGAAA
jgi:polyhydroxyalkanoate synthesis repressor PhaR